MIGFAKMDNSFSPRPDAPVLAIGAAGVDIVGSLQDDLKPGTSNPSRIRTSNGGVARNVAENLARLGHPVALLTVVGDDEAGDQILHQTAASGVDVSAAAQTSKYPTGAYLASVNSVGELQYAMDDMRAIATLSPSFLEKNVHLFKEASLLFVDANLPKPTLRKALSLARKSNLPVCADPTSVILADRLLPHISRLWMITPNCAEAGILCDRIVEAADPEQVMDAAKCLVGQGVNFVIITLAQLGVCYATSEVHGQVPAILTEIVDPTGGGDALTSAVIFALLNEIPFDDAIRLGVSAATLTLRYPGAVDPKLTLERLYDQLVI